MGQKIHPIGFRLGIATDWRSKWYAEGAEYSEFLNKDIEVRNYLNEKLKNASISQIRIERPAKSIYITISTARPGVVIGKKGEDIEKLRQEVSKISGVHINNVKVNIEEIRKPELDARLVAEGIANQLERRIMFRRAMKRAVGNAMRLGAEGIKINVAGRLNGAEIARGEWYREGRVPLHTMRADIDYATAEANTSYGIIGIKVWIYKGEVFNLEDKKQQQANANKKGSRGKKKRYGLIMLQPKRTKFRKMFKGKNRGLSNVGNKVSFGDFGLKALGRGRLTARQIEAARRAMTRKINRGGQIWIRVFPDTPITSKPLEVRMGKGKGNVEYWIAKIQPGRVLYEMDGVSEELAREAFDLAAAKLPFKTVFVTKQVM